MAILSALGFISLLKGVMQLHEDVLFVVQGFQAVTHPIWDYTIGYLTRWLGWPLPGWVQDYLTMGAITAGAELRTLIALSHWRGTITSTSFALALPLSLATWWGVAAYRFFDIYKSWSYLSEVKAVFTDDRPKDENDVMIR